MEQAKNSILIVDDEKINLKVLTQILSQDYIVYTAKDGQTAIDMVMEYLPDLVLLDVIMGEMNGYKVAGKLKEVEKSHDIPIIFITGLSSIEDEEIGIALGGADYISKPFSPVMVKLRVRNQLQIVNQKREIKRLQEQLKHSV
jgi:PleD family two-component response regulator